MNSDDSQGSQPGPSSSNTLLFLPPPSPPTPPTYLRSTQDLLARFQLLPAYDKYVRPHIEDLSQSTTSAFPTSPTNKGKDKEKETHKDRVASPVSHSPGADVHEAEDDDAVAKGERKKRNSYKHLIKGVPGKHSMKRDDYLTTIMQAPPKERISIIPFDIRTQQEAFTVSLEPLKGWNVNALIAETPQAREDRKKRKELKKLAKAQTAAASASSPNPSVPHSHSHPPLHPPLIPATVATTVSSAVPLHPPIISPTSSSFSPHTHVSNAQHLVSKVSHVHTATAIPPLQKGKKREREPDIDIVKDSESFSVATKILPGLNGSANGPNAKSAMLMSAGAKLASGIVRPRPIKKQRMDIQGHGRDVSIPVQQPTPQGV